MVKPGERRGRGGSVYRGTNEKRGRAGLFTEEPMRVQWVHGGQPIRWE